MIYFFTPYAQDKDLGRAYNDYVKLILNLNDWVCFIDGDFAMLTPDFGHQLQEIINSYPSIGLFTCYVNRVGNLKQCYRGQLSEDPNILNHRKIALALSRGENRTKIKEISNPISGHLMLFKKETWQTVGGFPEGRGILSVDNTFSNRIAKKGFKIAIMEGVYCFHFYRMDTGRSDRSHLK